MNRNVIERLIRNGLAEHHSPAEIADQICALSEDPTMAKALSHPTRGAIMRLLRRDGEVSPVQAAHQLDGTVGTIAYHFRRLQTLGLIEEYDQISRRGAIEHIYRLVGE